jgi:hypothetical protein
MHLAESDGLLESLFFSGEGGSRLARTRIRNSKNTILGWADGSPAGLSEMTRRLPEGPRDPTKIPRIQILMSLAVFLVAMEVSHFPR